MSIVPGESALPGLDPRIRRVAALLSSGVRRVAALCDWPAGEEGAGRLCLFTGNEGWTLCHEEPLPPANTCRRGILGATTTPQGEAIFTVSGGGVLILRADDTVWRLADRESPPLGAIVATETHLLAATVATDAVHDQAATVAGQVFIRPLTGSGAWQPVSAPGFGDPGNGAIRTLSLLDGQVYAGVDNPLDGFQLWRAPVAEVTVAAVTVAEVTPEAWSPVITRGAERFAGLSTVTAATVHQDALYLAVATGADDPLGVGNQGPELLRVPGDGDWSVVMGAPRFTARGLRAPVSLHSSGFDAIHTGIISALVANDRHLVLALEPLEDGPPEVWDSTDGNHWHRSGVLDPGGPVTAIGLWDSRIQVARETILKPDTKGEVILPLPRQA